MVIMQKIGGYVNATVINLLQMHYDAILIIGVHTQLHNGHKHWPFRGDVPQQRIRVFVISLGKDAIWSRKMQTWSAKLVHLAGFLFQNPHSKDFQN